MSTPAQSDAPRPQVAAWVVAGVLTLYYFTPLAARVAAGRPLDALAVATLLVPALGALYAARWVEWRPALVTGLAALALVVSSAAIGACWIVQTRLAHGVLPQRRVLGAGAVFLLAKTVNLAWVMSSGSAVMSAVVFEFALAVVVIVVATLVGFLVRSRRSEDASRREAEAARQAAEQARIDQARSAERERIAREMHDVVAHRISLIALHAGGLVHRHDLEADEMREVVRTIQLNAQESLAELRAVLGSLRATQGSLEPPQPSLAQLDALIADATAAGQRVDLDVSGDLAALDAGVSRQAYRIVQEALTNARKHAPNAPVSLVVEASPSVLAVQVSNPVAAAPPGTPGVGFGLVGIGERVRSLGGTETHGVTRGRFRLDITLPRARVSA